MTATRNSFGTLLSQTARHWRRAVDRDLQRFGLTEATWLPLVRLARGSDSMHQKALAASLSLDGSSVVRLLDSLQAAGLIERKEDDVDRRAKAIVLTALGRATVEQVETVARDVRERALAGLSGRDVQTTIRVLEHIDRVLSPTPEERTP